MLQKDIAISGIKPSGELHLGTLLGAILPFVQLQNDYDLHVFIADIHALTKPIEPELLRKYTKELIAVYLAAGLSNNVTIFKQSDIPAHAQLSQILTCYLDVPDLTKMPQFKNYCDAHPKKAPPAGMLDYVNWMNADILSYSPEISDSRKLKVICGQDQLPHVYLCQEVAKRFNKRYGESFKIPTAVLPKVGAKIMSLSNPTKKMSKSESDKGTIYLLDNIEITRTKIMRATTDSENKVYFDIDKKPGVSNLLSIMASLTSKTIEELEIQFKDLTDYRQFKQIVADVVCEALTKLQEQYNLIQSSNMITDVLTHGKQRAISESTFVLDRIYRRIGLSE